MSRIDAQLQNFHDPQSAMTLSEFDILASLYAVSDHRIPVADLVDRVLVTKSGFSRSLRRLEDKGWVTKTQLQNDRRCYLITLTEVGKAALLAVKGMHNSMVEEMLFSAFSADDFNKFRLLIKILERHHTV